MNSASISTQETQMIITMSDGSIARSIRNLLKHIPGIESVKVKKITTKNEVEKALEEAHSGRVTHYASVEDFFKEMEV